MSNTLAMAVLTQIRTDTALTVYDGAAGDNAVPPYVVVYVADDDTTDRLTFQSNVRAVWVYTHCVGGNGQTARAVKDRVRARLLDRVLAVDGWVCGPIRHIGASAPQTVEVASQKFVDTADVWRFHADPAPAVAP